MQATMKAIIKTAPTYGALEIQNVPIPVISKKDVLVKMRKTAICGTDAHIYKWDAWAQRTIKTPMTIGHEFVGEIAALGEDVSAFKIGQIVSGEGHVVCGKCRWCITGYQHLCRATVGIGVNSTGVFAEYAAIPAANIWPCEDGIDENILSIQDPLGNAVHTALTFDVLGEDVLVTGAGPIGIMSVPVLKMSGARNIVITDVNPSRLALAKELGATATVDVRTEKISETMANLGMTEGFDVGLEMSGNSRAFADMVDNMANGGKIAILGIFSDEIKIDWNKVIFNSLTLKGIYGREMFDTWYKMAALLKTGLDEKVARAITHEFHYTDFEKGFESMFSGEAIKVVLNW